MLLFELCSVTQQQQTPPTCLHLDTAACILLFALRFIGGFVTWGTWPRQVGVRSQVTAGNQRAHVDVVGKDVVANELTEQKDQVGELYSLTFVSGLRFKGVEKRLKSFNNRAPLLRPLE